MQQTATTTLETADEVFSDKPTDYPRGPSRLLRVHWKGFRNPKKCSMQQPGPAALKTVIVYSLVLNFLGIPKKYCTTPQASSLFNAVPQGYCIEKFLRIPKYFQCSASTLWIKFAGAIMFSPVLKKAEEKSGIFKKDEDAKDVAEGPAKRLRSLYAKQMAKLPEGNPGLVKDNGRKKGSFSIFFEMIYVLHDGVQYIYIIIYIYIFFIIFYLHIYFTYTYIYI